MTCKELIDFLMDYLDGELPDDEARQFDEHLEICPPCSEYLVSYRETVRLGKMICQPEKSSLPAELPEDLVQAILDARRSGG